jgi:hypothetical protein
MPQPEHRPPFRIADGLGEYRIWQLVEEGVRVKISCDACGHEALWTKAFMQRRLSGVRGHQLMRVASRLRCAGCRSPYVHLWRA